jgi:AhpD family alkylhydroperoxidase
MTEPRVTPGTRADVGRVNWALARVIGLASGGGPPNVFTTLARHRKVFRRWLGFAGSLMPGGLLSRKDSELVILRVAHLTDCEYERGQHVRLARAAGLTPEEIDRVDDGPDAPGWTDRQALLLRATDELHGGQDISDATWDALTGHLSEPELIELCLLAGHYVMLAGALNALRVQPDAPSGKPSKIMKLLSRR